MYTIKIEPVLDDFYWAYDKWKDYIHYNFDDTIVLAGNRDYVDVAEAY